MAEFWEARANLANGETLERRFPYTANGNYLVEMGEQYACECWLMEEASRLETVVDWYSVDYVNDEEEE